MSGLEVENSKFVAHAIEIQVIHVVETTRMTVNCTKNEKEARAKRAKLLFFNVKYANCDVIFAVVVMVA